MESNKIRYEYFWQDAYGNYRSKIKVTTDSIPGIWNYDGSSTGQAKTQTSERKLYPVSIVMSPFKSSNWLVFCVTSMEECKFYDPSIIDTLNMFGFEQEVFLVNSDGHPVGCKNVSTAIQGSQYCNVGDREDEVEYLTSVEHYATYIGLNVTGWNLEVAPGQVEIQLCEMGEKHASTSLHVLRYIMTRLAGIHNFHINFSPKPYSNLNGSGLHTNFSTKFMRECSTTDFNTFVSLLLDVMKREHSNIIGLSGKGNDLRLCGDCEASNAENFTYGNGNRLASVRLPPNLPDEENRRYIEDRRWGSNADPMFITQSLTNWAKEATEQMI